MRFCVPSWLVLQFAVLIFYGLSVSAEPPSSFDVRAAVEKMDQALVSDFAKAGLESAVRFVYISRKQFPPAGHEINPEFDKLLGEVQPKFQEALWRGDISKYKAAILQDRAVMKNLQDAYQNNERAFAEFQKSALARPNAPLYLSKAPGDLLLRAQLFYAVILYGVDSKAFDQWFKMTAIWPFC